MTTTEPTTTMTIKFETDLLHLFNHRFEKAAKKYAKLGQTLSILSTTTVVERGPRKIFGQTFFEEVSFTTMTISKPQIHVKPGVTFWGTVSLSEGIKTIYRSDECPEELVLANLELKCDHCNTNRRRNKYFVFQENGSMLRLGSTCVQPYYGLNIERILKCFDGIMAGFGEPIFSEGEYDGPRGSGGLWVTDLAIATEFVCASGRWNSMNSIVEDSGNAPSSQAIRDLLNDMYHRTTNATIKLFKEFCKDAPQDRILDLNKLILEKYSNPTNDFGWNIYNALLEAEYSEQGEPTGKLRVRNFVPYKCSGIASFAIYQIIYGDFRKKDSTEAPDKVEGETLVGSKHVGELKQRLTLKVKATDARDIENQWGGSVMVGMETETGDQLRWFYSGSEQFQVKRDFQNRIESGESFVIKGMVKRHGEFKGEAQTTLTRVSIVRTLKG